MAQTPQQRRANEAYAKSEASKRGKPATLTKKSEKAKSPISMTWIVVLGILIAGGALLEIIRIFFG